MRQRFLPFIAGDWQGVARRVFAPQRRLACIGPIDELPPWSVISRTWSARGTCFNVADDSLSARLAEPQERRAMDPTRDRSQATRLEVQDRRSLGGCWAFTSGLLLLAVGVVGSEIFREIRDV